MERYRCFLLLALLGLPCLLPAATIKKKDGQVVEGSVSGLIVQAKKPEKRPNEKGPVRHIDRDYYLTRGENITAIDENGVQQNGDREVVSVMCGYRGSPSQCAMPKAIEADILTKTRDWELGSARMTAGLGVLRMNDSSARSGPADLTPLLGELRVDPKTQKGRVIPAVEVTTPAGVVVIPLSDIAAFELKRAVPAETKEPAAEKKP
jgi:hypothetical protein